MLGKNQQHKDLVLCWCLVLMKLKMRTPVEIAESFGVDKLFPCDIIHDPTDFTTRW